MRYDPIEIIMTVGGWIIIIALIAYIITSVVLFIVDSIKAKREGRKRKVWIIVMFIVAIALAVIAALTIALMGLLAYMIMRSM